MALASLLAKESSAEPSAAVRAVAPRARSVIYLHMAGSPSQLEMFENKPALVKHNGQACPDSLLKGQRFAFIKGHPRLLGSPYRFNRHGPSGAWFSELLPELSSVSDKLAIVRSMTTDQFNHAPAQLLLHTGNARLGSPSMGSWVTYGLGSLNRDLPSFVVLVSGGKAPSSGKSVWGSGFLPSVYQGVQCRTQGDPVLYVSNPPGMDRQLRRTSLDALRDLNQLQLEEAGDPETLTRIEQYEMAYRMQISVPRVMDISKESPETLEAYGAKPGASSFGNNCLLARRLVEDGVRFVQLYDWGWDGHGTGKHDDLVHQLPKKCRETEGPIAALIRDLEQRGLLDETLIVWGGEFGRTSMMEARGGSKFLGRDHHPHAFTMFLAGGGVQGGSVYGATDELGYFVTENQVTVHDLHATILHQLGLDPWRLTHKNQGLNARLIGPAGDAKIHAGLLQDSVT